MEAWPLGVFILASHLMRPRAAGYHGEDGLRREGLEGLSGSGSRSIPLPGRLRMPTCQLLARGELPGTGERSSGMGREARPGHPSACSPAPQTGQWPSGAWGRRQLLPAPPAGDAGPSGHLHRHPHREPMSGGITTLPGPQGPCQQLPPIHLGLKAREAGDKGLKEEFRPQEGSLRPTQGTGIPQAAKCSGFPA